MSIFGGLFQLGTDLGTALRKTSLHVHFFQKTQIFDTMAIQTQVFGVLANALFVQKSRFIPVNLILFTTHLQ